MVQVRRSKNPRQGESLDKTMTKQTVQLRTRPIHKTRRRIDYRWFGIIFMSYNAGRLIMNHPFRNSLYQLSGDDWGMVSYCYIQILVPLIINTLQ